MSVLDTVRQIASSSYVTTSWIWTVPEAIPASYSRPLPPSVADDPFAFAISLSGLMIVSLVFANWVQRFFWAMIDKPFPLNHPVTVTRLILFLTGLSGVIRNGPDVLSWGLWRVQGPGQRFALSHWNRILDGVSAPPMVAAGLLVTVALPVLVFQLDRQPLPVNLYLSWRKMSRPIGAGVIATVCCFAIAFYR